MIRLLREEGRTAAQLAEATVQTPDDVDASIASLVNEGLVQEQHGRVFLRVETDALIQFVKMTLGTPHEVAFLTSDYFARARDQLVVPLCEARFRIRLSPNEQEALLNSVSLSPSALAMVVLGDTELYRNFADHLGTLNLSDQRRQVLDRWNVGGFVSEIARLLINDHKGDRSAPLQGHAGVKAVRFEFDLKVATISDCLVHLAGR